MTSPVDLPVTIAQLPHLGKLVSVEKAKAEVQQELFGPMLRKELERKEREQVEAISKKERTEETQRDGGNRQELSDPDQEDREKKEDEEELEHTLPPNVSPYTGTLVNKKV